MPGLQSSFSQGFMFVLIVELSGEIRLVLITGIHMPVLSCVAFRQP